jgi:hydrogenase maturation protein HypF
MTAAARYLAHFGRTRIIISGAVQGVGFRPFVYREATALGLAGWVMNSPEGVVIEVEGQSERVHALIARIETAPPANAIIARLVAEPLPPKRDTGFSIRVSAANGEVATLALPDLATCDECLRELFDEADRRYRYPFINCTSCGPRYSIIESLPYDRDRTSMRRFAMCAACRAEYDDPRNRRFHAEPNACPCCGPRLALCDGSGTVRAEQGEALAEAVTAVRCGAIVAMKGLGGFHLVVAARDEAAVSRLRERKQRPDKPFALMFPSLQQVVTYCQVSSVEKRLLIGSKRPIVLLRRLADRVGKVAVARNVAPGNPYLGIMLPYTPLHHLLMQDLDFPVVATSGNISDEPIVSDEREALARLGGVADLFLIHDRPIARPVDDSIVRMVAGREMLLRCARGYAPAAFATPDMTPGILALGGHQKATVAVTMAEAVVLGPHIGDLESPEGRSAYARAITELPQLHAVHPRLVARDLHPDYYSSHVAGRMGTPLAAVQHHVAHAAACMAEHSLRPPLLGIVWDGTGYGPDGTVWGGEFLHITDRGFRRVAHLRQYRLPGATAAAREPWRSALGLLYSLFGPKVFELNDLVPVGMLSQQQRQLVHTMLKKGTNAPLTSSAGRLFDAAASLIGLRQRTSYEGQAAAEFEWAADESAPRRNYEFTVCEARVDHATGWTIDWEPAMHSLLTDMRSGATPTAISTAFHRGLAASIAEVAARVNERLIVLTGGCFQNVYLSEATIALLKQSGFSVYWHERVTPNDGSIALGQAIWANALVRSGRLACA